MTDQFPVAALVLGFFVMPVGCAPPVPGPEAVKAELMAADRQFQAEVAERGLEAWVEWFAEDGVQVSGGEVIRGHDGIRQLMAGAFDDPTVRVEWEPAQAEITARGDLGYTMGSFAWSREVNGARVVTASGHYVTVWRRQPDGSFKAVLDMGSARPPVPPPAGNEQPQ